MIVLFAIDLEHHLLPNAITLPGIVAGFLFSLLFPPGPVASLLGILVGGGSLWLIGEAYYRYAARKEWGWRRQDAGDDRRFSRGGSWSS